MDTFTKQATIFDELPDIKLKNTIRLIEFFAGYGSQSLALEYLNANFEHYKISEWNYKSFKAYNEIHFGDKNDYSKDLTKEEIMEFLNNKVISSNWNDPMTYKQIKRLGETKLREIYNNFVASHNLGSVTQIKGSDLEIVDTDKYDYVLTYSFPCQDLSVAGKRKGMDKGTGTRSGLLWEVERILNELKNKPKVLLMENVPQVHGQKNLKPFNDWLIALQKLGYSNYFKDLNAKDYGIPQSRNRCFMVSILGDYNYTFPEKQPLELRLKDLLEDKVDEKYYLSQKLLKCFTDKKDRNGLIRNDMFKPLDKNSTVARTIKTTAGSRAEDNYIKEPIKIKQIGNIYPDTDTFKNKTCGRIYSPHGLSPTLTTSGNHSPIIKKEIQGNGLIAEETKKTNLCNKLVKSGILKGGEIINHSYTSSKQRKNPEDYIETKNGIFPTMTTRPDTLGYVENFPQVRIRRLTPLECFRLMGVKDCEFHKLNASNSALYHLAGDSIVVNVLMAIFKQML